MLDAINAWSTTYAQTIALLSLIVSALLAFLTFNYVRLTRATFVEIKKQTDHMTKPFIVIDCIENPSLKEASIHEKADELYKKWHKIVSRTDPESVSEKSAICLKINNIGKSDALGCKINVVAKVTPTEKMTQENTVGETLVFSIEIPGNIPPGSEVTHPFGWLGAFPKIEYTTSVSYSDVVNNHYDCAKSANHKWMNALLAR